MKRQIIAFHQDHEGHWVADLECGHSQHVRHEPPWQLREWVTTPEGRSEWLGRPLDCRMCDGNTGPAGLECAVDLALLSLEMAGAATLPEVLGRL